MIGRRKTRPRRKPASVRMLDVAVSDRNINLQISRQLAIGIGNPLPSVPDPRQMIIRSSKVYTMVRSVSRGSITVSSTLPTFGALAFALSDLPSASDFTSLFDQWKIQQVTVKFMPASLPSNSNAFHLPPLYTVVDYDDNVLPTSIATLQQYSSLQVIPSATVTHCRTLTPRLATSVFGNGVLTNYANARLWCDSAYPSVAWYGLKYGLPPTNSVDDFLYYIEAEYVISLRNTI
jgi:hypothetical protein